jgi:hypothetical protein
VGNGWNNTLETLLRSLMNIYSLIKHFWIVASENKSKIAPIDAAIYFFILHHANMLHWKPEFGLPAYMVMEVVGIGSYNTYKKHLDKLVELGFITIVSKARNQYNSCVVALSFIDKATDEATDKATDEATDEATDKATDEATDIALNYNNTVKTIEYSKDYKDSSLKKEAKGDFSEKEKIKELEEVNKSLILELEESKKKKEKTSGPKERKEELPVVMPFESDAFQNAWRMWVEYKETQHKFRYKTNTTIQAALLELVKHSNGIENTAIEIINQSIGNGWKGFFKLKNTQHNDASSFNNHANRQQRVNARAAEMEEFIQSGGKLSPFS